MGSETHEKVQQRKRAAAEKAAANQRRNAANRAKKEASRQHFQKPASPTETTPKTFNSLLLDKNFVCIEGNLKELSPRYSRRFRSEKKVKAFLEGLRTNYKAAILCSRTQLKGGKCQEEFFILNSSQWRIMRSKKKAAGNQNYVWELYDRYAETPVYYEVQWGLWPEQLYTKNQEEYFEYLTNPEKVKMKKVKGYVPKKS